MQRKKLALLQNLANNINQIAAHCNKFETAPQMQILQKLLQEVSKNADI